jgi:hypothetical protein
MVVIPRLDYSIYEQAGRDGEDKEFPTLRRADVRVVGYLPREYKNEITASQLVGSRMFHIGGIMARVTPKEHARVELSEDDSYKPDQPLLGVTGQVHPNQAGEKVSVFLTSPDGEQWVLERITSKQGRFLAVFDLTKKPTLDTLEWQQDAEGQPREPSGEIEPLPGVYQVQAFLVNSPNAAEAESNIVKIQKNF